MGVFVEKAAVMMTIQDAGRFGHQRFGLPESGPIDWWAFHAANLLVGNPPGWACVEIGFSSCLLVLEHDTLLAVCGAGYDVFINHKKIPLWMAIWVKKGDKLRLKKEMGGNWIYLGASGGLKTERWLGSHSVYSRAGLGRSIKAGDQLPLGNTPAQARQRAGWVIPPGARPAYTQDAYINVIPGPHQDQFQPESLDKFWAQPFSISPQSDRMGYRLQGTSLSHKEGADLISQGIVLGEIQVPADGQPIVMMPDHPTTGGYTCIGTVARVDLPLLAQAEFGASALHFQPVEVSKAQAALGAAIDNLEKSIQKQEDEWQLL